MIENTDQYPSMPSDGNDGDAFPTFFRPPADTDVDPSNHDLSGAPFSYETGHTCTVALAGELIEKIRKAGEEAEVQQQHEVPLTPKAGSKPTAPASSQVQQPISKPVQPEKKKNKNDSADHQQLIDRLSIWPKPLEFYSTHGRRKKFEFSCRKKFTSEAQRNSRKKSSADRNNDRWFETRSMGRNLETAL